MTIEEYIDILLENEIIMKGGSNQDLPYRFTDKGIQLIHDQFSNYPDSWYNAILISSNSLMFWGIEKGKTDVNDWQWISENEQDVMENTLKNVFHIDPDDSDYIEPDDILL